jgi:GMP synthase-like glutamine amidotransferase
LRLGILKTGAPPAPLADRFGDYPAMFRRLLGEDAHDYSVFAMDEGRTPASPDACDAWLITGSACGVYDPEPWIGGLMDFLRAAKGRTPLVGVCFGHQIMAEAFGGKVVKSPKGWAIGAHQYAVERAEPWMDGPDHIRLPASHQDQVVEKPPGAEVIAANAFTPFGALTYPDQKAISIQLHPEFEPVYAIALIEARRGSRYSDDEADRGIGSYDLPDDRARVGRWIGNFLSRATIA